MTKWHYSPDKKAFLLTRTVAQNTKSEDLELELAYLSYLVILAIVLGAFNSHCNISE